ncbi:MAG: hypothetical protein ACE5IW_09175 [bacterium]
MKYIRKLTFSLILISTLLLVCSFAYHPYFGSNYRKENVIEQQKENNAQAASMKGREILQKAVEAAGGLEKFAEIKSFRIKTQNVIYLTQNEMQLTVTETVMLPNQTKQVMEMPQGKRIQVLNGDNGWKQIGQNIYALTEAEKREMKRGLFRDTIRIYRMSGSEDLQIKYFGEESVGGEQLYVLQIKNKFGDFFNLYVDAESFLAVKKTYHGTSEVGLAMLEEIYSDYREVDGIKLPFHIEVRANGRKFIDSVVVDAKFNLEISEEFFLKK